MGTHNEVDEAAVGFEQLGLLPVLTQNLKQIGFLSPTPIQAKAIPHAMAGTDVLGCAQTGTGKTAAFLLPMLHRFSGKPGTRGLVLAPTRELALQIAAEVNRLGQGLRVYCTLLIGGVPYPMQRKHLSEKRSLVIATPGRLIDHLESGTLNLQDIEVLVLDEADRMLDMGFKPQLTQILKRIPAKRQTLLFSATMGGDVAVFAKSTLKDPVRIDVNPSAKPVSLIAQAAYSVKQDAKLNALLTLLAQSEEPTLVFTRTKHRADRVCKALQAYGLESARIHSERTQAQRKSALEGFRKGQYRVLVATDIAARGIDVKEIGHVVNFDLPHVAEDYVHRIGRTGRAGAVGRASSLVAHEEMPLLKGIEKLMKQPVPRIALEIRVLEKPVQAMPVEKVRGSQENRRNSRGKPEGRGGGGGGGGGDKRKHFPRNGSKAKFVGGQRRGR